MAAESTLNVDSIVEDIKNISKTKDTAEKDVNGLKLLLNNLLIDWSRNMCDLCSKDRYEDADRIADEITNLYNVMPEVFPQNLSVFARDRFHVAEHTILAFQYFKPQPFYPNQPTPNSLTKYIMFQVSKGSDIVLRYYLESSELDHPDYGSHFYYVLCTMSTDFGRHAQIEPYGDYKPSYKEMKIVVNEHFGKYLNRSAPTPAISLTRVTNAAVGGRGGIIIMPNFAQNE